MSLENNNNKDDKNHDKNKKEKRPLYQTMDNKGFYIILLLCVAIIAATAIWANNQKDDYLADEDPSQSLEEDNGPEVTLVEDDSRNDMEEIQQTGKIGKGKPKEDEKKPAQVPERTENKGDNKDIKDSIDKSNKDSKDKKDHIKKDSKEEETAKLEEDEEVSITEIMAMPVMGKLMLPFADNNLVYHKTLDQWSTHKGIDIQAAEGAPVKAVLDGEVVEVINDKIMGITITIKHSNDLLTIYSNLSTNAMVKVGEKVKKGQTISGVGKTATVKALQSPLLHFQVLKNDKFVNPELYLGQIPKC